MGDLSAFTPLYLGPHLVGVRRLADDAGDTSRRGRVALWLTNSGVATEPGARILAEPIACDRVLPAMGASPEDADLESRLALLLAGLGVAG